MAPIGSIGAGPLPAPGGLLPGVPRSSSGDPRVAAADASAEARGASFSLEQLIGLNYAGWIGAIVLVIGVGLGIKFAYDQGWLAGLPDGVRVALMHGAGLGLLAAGEGVLRRVGRQAAAGLYGAGVAVLFVASYAGHAWYGLYAPGAAYALMAGSMAVGMLMAARADLVSIAVLSVVGGGLAPLLILQEPLPLLPLMVYLLLLQLLAIGLCAWQRTLKWSSLRAVALATTSLWAFIAVVNLHDPARGDGPLAADDQAVLTAFAVLSTLLYHAEVLTTTLRRRLVPVKSAPPVSSDTTRPNREPAPTHEAARPTNRVHATTRPDPANRTDPANRPDPVNRTDPTTPADATRPAEAATRARATAPIDLAKLAYAPVASFALAASIARSVSRALRASPDSTGGLKRPGDQRPPQVGPAPTVRAASAEQTLSPGTATSPGTAASADHAASPDTTASPADRPPRETPPSPVGADLSPRPGGRAAVAHPGKTSPPVDAGTAWFTLVATGSFVGLLLATHAWATADLRAAMVLATGLASGLVAWLLPDRPLARGLRPVYRLAAVLLLAVSIAIRFDGPSLVLGWLAVATGLAVLGRVDAVARWMARALWLATAARLVALLLGSHLGAGDLGGWTSDPGRVLLLALVTLGGHVIAVMPLRATSRDERLNPQISATLVHGLSAALALVCGALGFDSALGQGVWIGYGPVSLLLYAAPQADARKIGVAVRMVVSIGVYAAASVARHLGAPWGGPPVLPEWGLACVAVVLQGADYLLIHKGLLVGGRAGMGETTGEAAGDTTGQAIGETTDETADGTASGTTGETASETPGAVTGGTPGATPGAVDRDTCGYGPVAGDASDRRAACAIMLSAALTWVWLLGTLYIDTYAANAVGVVRGDFGHNVIRQTGWSVWWGMFAVGLVVGGFVSRAKGLRVAGLVLLGVTLLKVTLVDLSGAGTGWRIVSFIGLGSLLLLTSVLYGAALRWRSKNHSAATGSAS